MRHSPSKPGWLPSFTRYRNQIWPSSSARISTAGTCPSSSIINESFNAGTLISCFFCSPGSLLPGNVFPQTEVGGARGRRILQRSSGHLLNQIESAFDEVRRADISHAGKIDTAPVFVSHNHNLDAGRGRALFRWFVSIYHFADVNYFVAHRLLPFLCYLGGSSSEPSVDFFFFFWR